MITKIYGASDDLIEIEGLISEEYGCYSTAEKGIKIEVSDGTIGKITYNGEWNIELKVAGKNYKKLVRSVGDDSNHTDELAVGCASYSDVLILEGEIEWIKIGRKKYQTP